MADADLYNFEFHSLIAKITQEINNHTCLDDKTLGEFVISLHEQSNKSLPSFKAKLKEAGMDFPDSFVENVDRLILSLHPKYKLKSSNATGKSKPSLAEDELTEREKKRIFPGLALQEKAVPPAVPDDVFLEETRDLVTGRYESPFKHLLHTSHIPSDGEIDDIRIFLSRPLHDLSNLQSEIERIQCTLNQLCQERDNLREMVDAHRVLISPVRRLPRDILEEIFLQCLPTGRNSVMSANEAPILLGRICSSWRTISLSTPRLWASIHISISNPVPGAPIRAFSQLQHRESFERYCLVAQSKAICRAKAITEWLGRSAPLPLSISLISHGGISDARPESHSIQKAFTQALCPFACRFKRLTLLGPVQHFALITKLTNDEVPLLQFLEIDNGNVHGMVREVGGSHLPILNAPQLRAVSLQVINNVFTQYDIPWSQLTELNLQRNVNASNSSINVLSITRALSILRICRQLTKCGLQIESAEEIGAHGSVTRTTLPLLDSLSLIVHVEVDVRKIVDILDLPSLRNMEFATFGDHRREALTHALAAPIPISDEVGNGTALLLILLRQWGCTLRTLTIAPRSLTPLDIRECLKETPFLTRLVFTDAAFFGIHKSQNRWQINHPLISSPLDDQLMESLTPSRYNLAGCLCPRLEELQCKTDSLFSDKALANFIRARRLGYKGIARLRRSEVIFQRCREDGVSYMSPPFAEEGLEGYLLYARRPPRGLFSPYGGIPYSPQEMIPLAPLYFDRP